MVNGETKSEMALIWYLPVFHGETGVQVELAAVPDILGVGDDVEEHRRRPRGRRVNPDGRVGKYTLILRYRYWLYMAVSSVYLDS